VFLALLATVPKLPACTTIEPLCFNRGSTSSLNSRSSKNERKKERKKERKRNWFDGSINRLIFNPRNQRVVLVFPTFVVASSFSIQITGGLKQAAQQSRPLRRTPLVKQKRASEFSTRKGSTSMENVAREEMGWATMGCSLYNTEFIA
jgi:hypothetical protein